MLDDFSSEDAVARLRAAGGGAALTASVIAKAAALADRLDHGVRIVFLGPEGVGKSTLCDTILGTWNSAAPQGRTRHFHSRATPAEPLRLSENMQTISLDLCQLGHAQIIDCASGADRDAVRKALALADIVLWCTQDFGPEEAGLWSEAPDRLKDHSFMVLTKADVFAEEGTLEAKIEDLQTIVSEEFHSLFPVAALQVLAVQHGGVPAAPEQLAASGVKALVDAVFCSVTAGQRADLDSAMLFIERHGLTRAEPVDPPARTSDTGQSGQMPFKDAYETLMARAFDLAELSFDESQGDMSEVLSLCGAISEELVDAMRRQGSSEPQWTEWSDQFEEASDKIMLMTMENDTRSAADAVTILLQLRRDMESLVLL